MLRQFAEPPVVVFVTAYEEHALAAFETRARDYLLKPVSAERLTAAIAIMAQARGASSGISQSDDFKKLTVETAGRTVFIDRDDVFWVEANGDYVRLHTATGGGVSRPAAAGAARRALGEVWIRAHPPQPPGGSTSRGRSANRCCRGSDRAGRRHRPAGEPPPHRRPEGPVPARTGRQLATLAVSVGRVRPFASGRGLGRGADSDRRPRPREATPRAGALRRLGSHREVRTAAC